MRRDGDRVPAVPGRNPRVTVVLLHGFPLEERMWEPQVGRWRGTTYGRRGCRARPSIDSWAAQILTSQRPVRRRGRVHGRLRRAELARQAPSGYRAPASSRAAATRRAQGFRNELIEQLRAAGSSSERNGDSEELISGDRGAQGPPRRDRHVRPSRRPLSSPAGDRDPLPRSTRRAPWSTSRRKAGSSSSRAPATSSPSSGREEFNGVLLDFVAQAR